MTVNDDGMLLSGATLESFVEGMADTGVDVVGLNCSVGPRAMLDALETLKTLTRCPLPCSPTRACRRTSAAATST